MAPVNFMICEIVYNFMVQKSDHAIHEHLRSNLFSFGREYFGEEQKNLIKYRIIEHFNSN